MLPKEGHLLRIFVGEADRHDRMPLYEWIVREARTRGLAGATVLRGVEGFGAKSQLHKASILRLSADLPIVIEIVDTREKIESFLPVIDVAITDGLATIEKVEIRFYRTSGTG
jgi:PII-like signaling protein